MKKNVFISVLFVLTCVFAIIACNNNSEEIEEKKEKKE